MAAWPTPVPAWSKLAGKFDPWNVKDWAQAAIQYVENMTTDDQWRRLQVKFKYVGSGGTSADDAITTYDVTNITGGQLDSTWTTSDYTTAEGSFDTFFNSLRPYIQPTYVVSEYRWYKRAFTDLPTAPIPPGQHDKPFQDAGPPERIVTKNIIPTGSIPVVAQVAFTITEKTPWPKHWGRNYYPCCLPALLDPNGRFVSATMTTIVTAAQTLHTNLAGNDFQLIVPVTSFDKAPARTFLQVTQLQMDDVPDIIRRRRLRNVITRAVKP